MALSALDLVNNAKQMISEVTVDEAIDLLNSHCIALDVREHAEFTAGHITNARHLTRGVLEFKVTDHPDFQDRDRAILVYCKTGGRSALASVALQQLGYSNVMSLIGGFDAWQQKLTQVQQAQQQ